MSNLHSLQVVVMEMRSKSRDINQTPKQANNISLMLVLIFLYDFSFGDFEGSTL